MTLLRRLIARRDGVSSLETALVIPLIVAVAMGAAEIGRYAFASLKMQAAATQLADVVSREEEAITHRIDDALLGVAYTANPFRFQSAGKAVVSLVLNDNGDIRIAWQREGGGWADVTSRLGGSGGPATLPSGFILEPGESVLTAEIFYRYSPVIAPGLVTGEVYRAAYYRPRRGDLAELVVEVAEAQ
ncbi:MAG: pilus assembly protein [Alphaproteobacteria bacterium]|nr:pilus assembly protein [Alphaproteobacteria bacterium]